MGFAKGTESGFTFRDQLSCMAKERIGTSEIGEMISLVAGCGAMSFGAGDATTMIRDYIVGHGDEFDAIIKDKGFSSLFTIKGQALKNVPRGYDAAHPQAEYLKFKSWYLEYPISDSLILSNGFADEAGKIFLAMKPFNDYLNTALIS